MENKVKVWLARDKDASLWLCQSIPLRDENGGILFCDKPITQLDSSSFPSVKCEDDEPTEAYITLVNEPQPKHEIDWEQRRYDIAKDLYVRYKDMDAKWAVHATDLLINELKKESDA